MGLVIVIGLAVASLAFAALCLAYFVRLGWAAHRATGVPIAQVARSSAPGCARKVRASSRPGPFALT
jgi:hypothetical protein